jgi:hypothetical protein
MRSAAILLLTLGFSSAASGGEYQRIPGTGVSLVVPQGFRVSSELPGIGRDEDVTSLLVSQLPAPFATSRESFTREALATRGVTLHRGVEVEVAGREGLLLHASQRAEGVAFRKWILLLGDERASVLLTATTPLDLETVHQKALVSTLQSARWDPDLEASAAPGLRFRVGEVPPLRIVSSAKNAVVLSDPGHTAGAVAPLVVVGSSLGRVQIGDLAGFARRRLEQTVSIEQIEVVSEEPGSLDGLPGHRIEASARDGDSQRPVHVTQLLATDGERYYLLQGIADAETRESFAALLEQVIASFALLE